MTPNPMMIARDFRITARDSWPLAATLYEPTAKTGLARPLGLMILNSEAGTRRQFYADFASHVAGRGVAVLTYDYRGIGGSMASESAAKGITATLAQWGRDDFAGALGWAIEHHPDIPPFVLGHGVGGQIIGLADNAHLARSLLLVGAGHGYWRLRDSGRAMKQAWFWHVTVPATVNALGYLPGKMLGLREDLPGGVALRWARWARNPDYLVGVEPEARMLYARYEGPITAYSSIDDPVAPPRLVEALLGLYPSARATHIPLTPAKVGLDKIGHYGFFDRKMADHLWPRMTEWLRRTVTEVAKEIALEDLIEARSIGKIRTPKNARMLAAKLREEVHARIIPSTEPENLPVPISETPAGIATPRQEVPFSARPAGLINAAINMLGTRKTTTITQPIVPTTSAAATVDDNPVEIEQFEPEENSRAARRASRRQRRTAPDQRIQNPGPQTEYPSPAPPRLPGTDQQA